MERYFGTLMYCTYLPFSIYSPDEKEALAELQKGTPEILSEEEKIELSAHLARIPQADRVMVIKKETSNAEQTADKESPLEVA